MRQQSPHTPVSNNQLDFFHRVSGERARELLFLYGEKGQFLVRPSESNAHDHTLSVHRGNRVTHVKLPFNSQQGVYRLPSGQEFPSLPPLIEHLLRTPNCLSERDGSLIELTRPCPIPQCESVVNSSTDRFFHLQISGLEAEELLREEPVGTFLVRESTSTPGEYALSVRGEQEDSVLHVKIHSDSNGRFRVIPKDSFSSLADLIEHYVRTPMVQNGGTTVKLTAPLRSTRFTAATIDQRLESLTRAEGRGGIGGHGGKMVAADGRDGIVDEFERIHNDKETLLFISCKEGRRPQNLRKNRYRNVVPYDHTRIRLKRFGGGGSEDDMMMNEESLKWTNEQASTSGDYINANWIEVMPPPQAADNHSGSSRGWPSSITPSKLWTEYGDFRRRYISTQGPLPETVADFWRMVWQESTTVVVALTREVERGRAKCARYWPEGVGEELRFESGDDDGGTVSFVVRCVNEEGSEGGDYIIRHLQLTLSRKRRKEGKKEKGAGSGKGEEEGTIQEVHDIYHHQFLAWEDNSVCALNSVLLFLDEVNRKLEEAVVATATLDSSPRPGNGQNQTPPMVVHCSAGIGRTGTFIVLDILLNRIKAVGPQCIVDIPKTVRMLREQRATMVQTEAQYRFIYQAISAYMRLRREPSHQQLQINGSTDGDSKGSPQCSSPFSTPSHLPSSMESLSISQKSLAHELREK